MNYSVSNTAEYGEYVSGPRVVNAASKEAMRQVLADIQSGKFVKDWMLENRVNQTSFKAMRAKCDAHEMEEVGKRLRAMMPWIAERALVDEEQELTSSAIAGQLCHGWACLPSPKRSLASRRQVPAIHVHLSVKGRGCPPKAGHDRGRLMVNSPHPC